MVDARRRARAPTPSISAGELERPPRRERRARARTAARSGSSDGRERATRAGLSACTTSPSPVAGSRARRTSRPTSVSAAGKAHCAGTPASASVRAVVGELRHRRVRVEHDPRSDGVAGRARRRAGASSGSCSESAQEAGRADDLLGPVDGSLDRNRPSRAAAAIGSSHCRPGGYDGGRAAAEEAGAVGRRSTRGMRRGRGAVKSGRGTFSGRRSGSRRRTETTAAPAASAFSHSVAAAMPAPTTVTSSRVLVRLVRVHGARVVRQLDGTPGPGGRARPARAGTARAPSSSKPPSTARTRSTRAGAEALVPAEPLAHVVDVRRGTRSTVGR